ncbi:hypothetical protein GGR56DRAFT_694440 [Xylariaceae sp. FL0804]|nr:hypothetical protein GGR56DRAFT_694440 [Xylariaceae sp. FL0804]
MSQQSTAPMLINIPQPPSNPETPSDMPGTPTSATTSLSALSTTAIKDGHRGHPHLAFGGPRGHVHQASTNSLEAERADRISRLAGLERVSTLRAPNQHHSGNASSPQTTPTSSGFPQNLPSAGTPAYFDQNGQPTAVTKMSTVGTASATGSVGARTATEPGEHEMDADMTEVDEDGMSMDTNYRTMDVDSTGAMDHMDEDMASRSVGGFEDRMSDDGNASLVGFGEGANSTVSGPIYQRRPLPGGAGASGSWNLERSTSGLSHEAMLRHRELRGDGPPGGNDTPISARTAAETRAAKYVDGVAAENGGGGVGGTGGHVGTSDDDMFVDTTAGGPIPVQVQMPQPGQPATSALREGVGGPASREAAERIVRERLDAGEASSPRPLSEPRGGDKLGTFYFEDNRK